MKLKTLLILILLPLISLNAQESKTKLYSSISTEMIFSFANIDNNGSENGNIMRWAPVFNPQWMLNADFSKNFGLFTGLAIRNVGFIYDNPDDADNARYKFRTYNLGLPVGLKLGKFDSFVFFAGYEIEFPFVYKEKKFVNEVKTDKSVIWFSSKVETIQHSLMGGIQGPHGATLKFKYYLSNFHNRDYVAMVNGVETKPYDFKANVFYISLAFNVFGPLKDYVIWKE